MKGTNIFLASLISVDEPFLSSFPYSLCLIFFRHWVAGSCKDANKPSLNLDLAMAGSCKDVKDPSLLDDIIAEVEYLNFWISINPNYDYGHFSHIQGN